MTFPQAAKVLNFHISTLRKWVGQGAPTDELGAVGRGHATQVDPDALMRWRMAKVAPTLARRSQDELLTIMETALLDCVKRDSVAAKAGLTDGQAAMVVLLVFERLFRNVKETPLTADHLPAGMASLRAIYIDSIERRTFSPRR